MSPGIGSRTDISFLIIRPRCLRTLSIAPCPAVAGRNETFHCHFRSLALFNGNEGPSSMTRIERPARLMLCS